MTVLDYLRVLRRAWRWLVVGAAAGAGLLALYCVVQVPEYRATSEVFVSTPSGSVSDLSQGGTFAQQVVKSYASVAGSPLVLDAVISELRLDTTAADLRRQVDVSTLADQVLITIDVRDPSPTRAARIANAITAQLTTAVQQLTPETGQTAAVVRLTQTQIALPDDSPVSPRRNLLIALGLLVGALVAAGAALLVETLHTRLRGTADLAGLSDRPVLGEVPYSTVVATTPAAVQPTADPRLAEALRFIRANLRFLEFDASQNSFVVTSAVPGEGKTSVAAGLAVVLAEAGRRVLVIDADLHRPRLLAAFGLAGEVGLSELLTGQAVQEDAVQRVGDLPLWVLPSGALPPNPNDLLQSAPMRALVEQMTARFDHVIFDAPPCLAVSDAAVLAEMTGGVVYVSGTGVVRTTQVSAALSVLERAHVRVLGHIVTMSRADRSEYSYEYAARSV